MKIENLKAANDLDAEINVLEAQVKELEEKVSARVETSDTKLSMLPLAGYGDTELIGKFIPGGFDDFMVKYIANVKFYINKLKDDFKKL